MDEPHRHEWTLAILYDDYIRAQCQYPTCHAELNWVEIEERLNELEALLDECNDDDNWEDLLTDDPEDYLNEHDPEEASTEDLDWEDRCWIP